VQDKGLVWSPAPTLSRASGPRTPNEEAAPAHRGRVGLRDLWFTALLLAILSFVPALSVQAAAWSDRLEPVPWIALLGVVTSLALSRGRISFVRGLILGLAIGLVLVTIQYAWFQSNDQVPRRLGSFIVRITDWFGAAFSGAASTDNLLFAYTMGLLAWLIGYLGSWFALRRFTPWWAIIPSGGALLLNLSYAQPDLLPLVTVQLVASFLLLIAVNSLRTVARWRSEDVDYGFMQGTRFAATGVILALAIILVAWRMPVGEVSRGVASAWERVAGPWQSVQVNFDRLFASLNPSPLSGKGLTVAQTMAPRGSFDLGQEPVMRISGREPAYWRAATLDRYTGRVVANSNLTSQRLDRSQPIEGNMQTSDGRKFVEYGVTLIAPSSSVIYAPDTPMTVSIPSIYEYRGAQNDYALLRPVAPIREQQRYSVLASVSTASISELRQAGTIFPQWVRNSYLQLPPTVPQRVSDESWRVVGDASNMYDAASNIEQYLRAFKYSTRVPVPPADRDWVSFLLFESKEGYCDYYATAMMVMLRAVGIPARVASGYVTGEWEPTSQSYLVSEKHAHTWTEVYFPGYGWITFEPSANRPAPVRPERPQVALTDEEIQRVLEGAESIDDFLDDEDLYDSGNFVPLPADQSGPALSIGLVLLFSLATLAAVGSVTVLALWFRGIPGLPLFARVYARVVRLATWCGLGPQRSQTPYEYTRDLARVVPAAAEPLSAIADAYVAGAYGGRRPEGSAASRLRAAGADAQRLLFRSLAVGRLRRWFRSRVGELVAQDARR
jgi:transglutaminase-like putative cysteine protease